MSNVLLIESIVGLALVVNALRPLPWWTGLSVPSFFLSWLTLELAPQSLVISVGLTAGLVAAGGWEGTAGTIGIILSMLIWAGLVWLIAQSLRVKDLIEDALGGSIGSDYLERIAPHRETDYDLRVPWRQLILPFWMRHPDVERVKDVPYGEVRRRNLLDVYHHHDRPQGAPILLQIHGGGWTISNKNQQGKPIMLHFASRGWLCFAPNYRLSPRSAWPDHIVDIKRAVAWIREHAHEYGGDPSFIAVTGGSAGGHLTALLALSAGDPAYQPGFEDADTSVQAAIPHYGVYDFADTSTMPARFLVRFLSRTVFKKPFAEHREEFEAASPVRRVREKAPPFFVIHGHHDSLAPVEQARRFAEQLREISKSPTAYAELPGAQHAFDVFPSIRTAYVIRGVERFADYAYGLFKQAGPVEESPSRGAAPDSAFAGHGSAPGSPES